MKVKLDKTAGYCEVSKNKKITFKEKQSSITFENPSEYTCFKITVDGGLIVSKTEEKCDGLLLVAEPPTITIEKADIADISQEHYVELKGGAVKHALEQIVATLNLLADPRDKAKRYAYVVCTKNRMPKTDSTVQKLEKIIKQTYKAKLEIKEYHTPKLF